MKACRNVSDQMKEEILHDCFKLRTEFLRLQNEEVKQSLENSKDQKDRLYPAIDQSLKIRDHEEKGVSEYTEIGWEGQPEELVLFMLISGCQCIGENDKYVLLDPKVTKIGISFRPHKKYKSLI